MIVFCTTCKGRAQHVELTLPRNLADNPTAKFLILDYNSQDHLAAYLRAKHRAEIDSGRLVVYRFPVPAAFRMAHAKNMAHRLGIAEGGDVLVNLDADNLTGPGFADYVGAQFREHGNEAFLWARMLPGVLPRGISGRIAVPAQAFINAGGYDERFETWAPDDKDFNARLRRMGYQAHEIDPRFLDGLNHNDRMRFKEYPEAAEYQGGEDEWEAVAASGKTVANFGRFGTGVVFRNFGREPIELGPMPTRIFGIGIHKTATTSLHQALRLLGIDSAHWKSAHWAKAIFDEMRSAGTSRTLERHYALSDLPIALLFRELDQAYPRSKFILTIRGERRWLESVRNHWSHDSNPFRADWSKDPFTHRVHRELYGTKGFDAGVMLARYRSHNMEVREYFKSRPEDLLIMDMDAGAGWHQLCGFLKKPIPEVDYPVAFATRKEAN